MTLGEERLLRKQSDKICRSLKWVNGQRKKLRKKAHPDGSSQLKVVAGSLNFQVCKILLGSPYNKVE